MEKPLERLFAQTLEARGIPLPSQALSADNFLRWGKNNRYSAKALGNDGIFIHDFSTGEDIYQFLHRSTQFSEVRKKLQQQKPTNAQHMQDTKRLQEQEAVSVHAENLWNQYSDTGQSEYLNKKQALAHGIRYGQGAIVVPIRSVCGKLWSLHFIYDAAYCPEHLKQQNRNKDLLKGGKFKGCFHHIGELENAAEAYVCEGYATGSSIHQATGKPVITALSAVNIAPVIAAIKERYPQLQLTIAADNDCWKPEHGNTGKKKAEENAKLYNCRVALPQFNEASNQYKPTDFNDLHCFEGLDIVAAQLSAAIPIPAESDEETLKRLATLSALEYDRLRTKEAKRLGVSVTTLDKAVKEKCTPKPPADRESLLFPDDDAWPERVDLNLLLNELAMLFRRFAILPIYADTVLSLWTVFTWCIDGVNVAPILAISSPEKQCGKSTVLSLLGKLAAHVILTSNITASSLFRAISKWHPTLLIDEADTFIRESEELRGILNSGHTRDSAYTIRCVGDDHEPMQFDTWGAKAIALIGKLPDTLHDRAIVIELCRKRSGEYTEKIRHADNDSFAELRSKLRRFAEDNVELLKSARPTLPDSISDRAADNWEPLLAIASLAGKSWKEKAMEAAIALSHHMLDAASIGTELLSDIEDIFSVWPQDKISSGELIKTLCANEERPWNTYNRGQPITPRQMAKILSEYHICSKTIRLSTYNTPKGYERSQFEDAFSRYLNNADFFATPPQTSESGNHNVAVTDSVAVASNSGATQNSGEAASCGVVATFQHIVGLIPPPTIKP